MDFGTLLQTAKQNESQKKEVRSYSTKFAPPKKEDKKANILSANIQKFLARKESEEKKKIVEAHKKRDDLLALRSKDKKATRRVNVMLKRTKSANQSVIDDAVDNDNTAVTLAGPAQPDEDDYGYVSQEASAYYNKMMEKYNKIPEEQKFPDTKKRASSNLSNTKDRVRAALEREKLEAMMPHKRKRKHKEEGEQHEHHENNDYDDDEEEDSVKSEQKKSEPSKIKPKIKVPPPMNFTDLLRLASQKQHEPIMIDVKPKDEGPLFTKKQKQELEKEQQRRGDEKGKLSVEQINDIRKLPPSHLYKTKRQRSEISHAEIHENSEDFINDEDDDDDNYDDDCEETKNINQNRKIPNNNSFDRTEVPYNKITKIAYDNQESNHKFKIPNGVGSSNVRIIKPSPNAAHVSKMHTQNVPKNVLVPKIIPERNASDVRISKSHSEKEPNDTHISKPFSEKTPNNAHMLKTHSGNDGHISKMDSGRVLNGTRFHKGSGERLEDSKAIGKFSNSNKITKIQNGQCSKPLPNKPLPDNRPHKTVSEKPHIDNPTCNAYRDSVPNGSRQKILDSQKSKFNQNSKIQVRTSTAGHKQESNKNHEFNTSKLQLSNGVQRKNDINQAKLKNNKINNSEIQQKKPLPPDDRQPKPLPSKDLKPKQFPPPNVIRRKELPLQSNVQFQPPISNKRRINDHDEEEYDSEMDDFIDDGPEEGNDYSSYIREIFGYDKRKYRRIEDDDDDDDDVDNMESSFAQQMREDIRSTKIGIMEDLEDIEREKQEKKRKALKKKGHM